MVQYLFTSHQSLVNKQESNTDILICNSFIKVSTHLWLLISVAWWVTEHVKCHKSKVHRNGQIYELCSWYGNTVVCLFVCLFIYFFTWEGFSTILSKPRVAISKMFISRIWHSHLGPIVQVQVYRSCIVQVRRPNGGPRRYVALAGRILRASKVFG